MTFFPDRNPTIIRPFVPCTKVSIGALRFAVFEPPLTAGSRPVHAGSNGADRRRLSDLRPVPLQSPILLRTFPLRRRGRFAARLELLGAPVLPPAL